MDIGDEEPITPNHFLGGEIHRDLVPLSLSALLPDNYRLLQESLENFKQRLALHLTPSLRSYTKWQNETPNVKVGDLVVVLEAQDTGHFPLARVLEVHRNVDGQVRKVSLFMYGGDWKSPDMGVVERPISMICRVL